MDEIKLNTAKLYEAKHWCDENGIDIADLEHGDTRAQRLAIIARIRKSGLVDGETIEFITEPVAPATAKIENIAIRTAQDNIPLDSRYVARMRMDPRNPFPGKYVGDTVRVMVPAQNPKHEPGGDQPVILTVNTVNIAVPRGQWVDMPYKFAVVLANAKYNLHHSDDERGLSLVGETYQYPFHTSAV